MSSAGYDNTSNAENNIQTQPVEQNHNDND